MNDKKNKIIELLEEAAVLDNSISWWIESTENIMKKMDKVEAQPYFPDKDKVLEGLVNSLKVLMARKRMEEKNIDDLIERIDKVNQ